MRIAVLTVSDSRSLADDSSGDFLIAGIAEAGHSLHERQLLPDDRYLLRALVSNWIADPECQPLMLRLKSDLLPAVLAFQDEYSLEAALVFWLPTGKNRVKMNRATEAYSWVCSAPHSNQHLDLGRILWAGAEGDVGRIIDPDCTNTDPDGPAWIGLHHPRLS